jgi:hypothetical protein
MYVVSNVKGGCMSKLTDNLGLNDLGGGNFRGSKTIDAANVIGNKKELSNEEIDILIEAGYYRETGKFKSANELIKSRIDEIFSVMAFAAESSDKWRQINEDEAARNEFIKNYRKGAAGLVQRSMFGEK